MEHLAAGAKESIERYITENTQFVAISKMHRNQKKIKTLGQSIKISSDDMDEFDCRVSQLASNLKFTLEKDGMEAIYSKEIVVKTFIDGDKLFARVNLYWERERRQHIYLYQ